MNRIKELREKRGIKQAWLAQKLHVRQTAVSNYELGIHDPSVDAICLMCDIFECSADYLLGRDEVENSKLSPQDAALLEAFHAAPATIQTGISVLLSPYMADAEKKKAAAG